MGGDRQIDENRQICRWILLFPAAILEKPWILRVSGHRSRSNGGRNPEIHRGPDVNGTFYKQNLVTEIQAPIFPLDTPKLVETRKSTTIAEFAS